MSPCTFDPFLFANNFVNMLSSLIMDELLTQQQLLDYLQISRSTLNRWLETGYFPKGIKMGKTRRWSKAELMEWLEQRKKNGND